MKFLASLISNSRQPPRRVESLSSAQPASPSIETMPVSSETQHMPSVSDEGNPGSHGPIHSTSSRLFERAHDSDNAHAGSSLKSQTSMTAEVRISPVDVLEVSSEQSIADSSPVSEIHVDLSNEPRSKQMETLWSGNAETTSMVPPDNTSYPGPTEKASKLAEKSGAHQSSSDDAPGKEESGYQLEQVVSASASNRNVIPGERQLVPKEPGTIEEITSKKATADHPSLELGDSVESEKSSLAPQVAVEPVTIAQPLPQREHVTERLMMPDQSGFRQPNQAPETPQVRIGQINVLVEDQTATQPARPKKKSRSTRANPFGLRGL